MVQDWPGSRYSRHDQYSQERFGIDGTGESRFAEIRDDHRRPQQINEALRVHCGIPAKSFFLAVTLDDGSSMTFSGPNHGISDAISTQFFSMEKYYRILNRQEQGASLVIDENFNPNANTGLHRSVEHARNRHLDSRRRLPSYDDWSGQLRHRKRARPRNEDDDTPMAVATTRRGIKIGDSEALWLFYEQRFKNCQQSACKLIAKAWVKAVEPKKQSTHPYTGSDAKAPAWWPKPWGPTKEDKVRHKEPDHLYKRERVHLLNHILRLIITPNQNQHPDIQKLNLNLKKLEEITTEALSGFFADKENPANAKKRPYLSEIFRVARQEERFRNDEIDGTTEVYVMAEDKLPESYPSENDDGSVTKEEDEHDVPPEKSAAHTLMSTGAAATEHSPAASLHTGSFLSDLPVRGTPYTPSIIQEMAPPEPHPFVEGNNLQVSNQGSVHQASGSLGLDIGLPSPHEPSRRPSIFNAPAAEYTGQTGTAIYTPPTPWQPGSTASNTASMYSFTPQQTTSSPAPFVNTAVPITQSQSYIGQQFEGISRPGYTPSQSSIFRGNSVQSPVHPPQTYNYLGQETQGVKVDSTARHSMH